MAIFQELFGKHEKTYENSMKMMAYANMPQRILLILFQTLVLSVVDSGFGLLTLSKIQIARLEVIQNQGMRTILGSHETRHVRVCVTFLTC